MRSLALCVSLGLLGLGCGARSDLPGVRGDNDAGPEAAPIGPECQTNEECEGAADKCRPMRCRLPEGVCEHLPEVVCDDFDPCTGDRCVADTGQCVFEPLSFDLDQDGYKGPRAGYAVGDPDACGEDCDDTSPLAHPEGEELCDGVDNDCNGIVDDGASFLPSDATEIRISGDKAPAQPTGFGWSGDAVAGYLAAYTGTDGGKTRVYLQRLAVDGQMVDPAAQLTMVNADADGGTMVWTGDRYGIAWSDRRNQDYEIYFNLADAYGTKLIPDVRVSNEFGFSVYPSVVFDGTQFVVAWQDDRDGLFDVFAQRIALDGTLVGSYEVLTAGDSRPHEAPFMARGDHSLGLTWVAGGTLERQIRFRTFDSKLQPVSATVPLTDPGEGGVFPMVVWNGDAYVAAWYDADEPPYTIYGAVVDEAGAVLTPARPLATSPEHARYPWLLPLGDRLLVIFSDDRDGNEGYELYAKMLTTTLEAASQDVRITKAVGHSIYPMATFGPTGDVGVLYRDDRLVDQHVFFTRLSCVLPE